MKKLLSFTAIIFGIMLTFAQAPEKFSYQAIIRNASNALVTNANVGMKISILKTSAAGTVVYSESQTAMTNINGLVSIQIGAGTPITGTIAGINWGADSHYIKTETDPAGGTSYSISGTTQLLSVPYALFAKNSEAITPDVHITSLSGSTQSIPKSVVTGVNSWTGLQEAGGANYNVATGEYTIPVTGYYSLTTQVAFAGTASSDSLAEVAILKNGNALKYGLGQIITGSRFPYLHTSVELQLVAGDIILVAIDHIYATPLTLQANLSGFGVHLIHK